MLRSAESSAELKCLDVASPLTDYPMHISASLTCKSPWYNEPVHELPATVRPSSLRRNQKMVQARRGGLQGKKNSQKKQKLWHKNKLTVKTTMKDYT